MQATKSKSSVLNADALEKAVAEMWAILAQMDAFSHENAMTTKAATETTSAAQSPLGSTASPPSRPTTLTTAMIPRQQSTNCSLTRSTAPDLRAGYLIFPKPILADESDKRTHQVGTFIGKPVYHYWSRAEQFLSSFEYVTPFGKRFLFDEPDSLLPPEDESDNNHKPSPGVWWSGPGNANKTFRFQRYFEIRPSKLGGLGAYATANIEIGKVILLECPLLLTTHANVSEDVLALPPAALAMYKSLDGGHSPCWVDEIKNRNCFDLRHMIGFFAIASRFNHACHRTSNVSYMYDNDKKVMVFSANKDIGAGTELSIDYGAGSSACLYAMYGFVCRCSGGCRPLTRRDLEAMGAGLEECVRWGLASKREMEW
ncbi:hypothetical protein QBC36DRAFT_198719 [Triangularia setosa]|uniref:SET domain-containing protein n=1 Tax=Triangularia setosa TaxID=2587417 RepID=A0AAN6VXP5_9PEZI|nr:hypothetical protein QBC36DRAFT_198719 [Podospora setosa]